MYRCRYRCCDSVDTLIEVLEKQNDLLQQRVKEMEARVSVRVRVAVGVRVSAAAWQGNGGWP